MTTDAQTQPKKPKGPTRAQLLEEIDELRSENEALTYPRDVLIDLEHEYWYEEKYEHAEAIREAIRRLDES